MLPTFDGIRTVLSAKFILRASAGGFSKHRAILVATVAAICLVSLLVEPRPSSAADSQTQGMTARKNLDTLMSAFRRPHDLPSPPENPTTPAKVELGKSLFFDPRLSASGKTSCGTCHNPSMGWEDGRPTALGDSGAHLPRHTPSILNVAWAAPLFWDGRADDLEEQAKGPLSNPKEMNLPLAQVASVVAARPGYVTAFHAVFPGKAIDIDTISKAIAAYQRTVVSAEAPFDRWVNGDHVAISAQAKRGFILFTGKAHCAECHTGWRFTDDGFHDVGLADKDLGRGKIMPRIIAMDHAFKTPTLRNITERGPYMHDGSLTSLKQVVEFYDDGFTYRPSLAPQIKHLKLTSREQADLVAFLGTLTSKDPDVPAPNFP
jgi:cytochrome c peroxidase